MNELGAALLFAVAWILYMKIVIDIAVKYKSDAVYFIGLLTPITIFGLVLLF